jgi:S1-C subfamily serine protease
VVACVVNGGPGAKAGLRGGTQRKELNGLQVRLGGDVVVRIGNNSVQGADDLVRVVSESLAPGQVVQFTLLRGGKRIVVPIRLGERPSRPAGGC